MAAASDLTTEVWVRRLWSSSFFSLACALSDPDSELESAQSGCDALAASGAAGVLEASEASVAAAASVGFGLVRFCAGAASACVEGDGDGDGDGDRDGDAERERERKRD